MTLQRSEIRKMTILGSLSGCSLGEKICSFGQKLPVQGEAMRYSKRLESFRAAGKTTGYSQRWRPPQRNNGCTLSHMATASYTAWAHSS